MQVVDKDSANERVSYDTGDEIIFQGVTCRYKANIVAVDRLITDTKTNPPTKEVYELTHIESVGAHPITKIKGNTFVSLHKILGCFESNVLTHNRHYIEDFDDTQYVQLDIADVVADNKELSHQVAKLKDSLRISLEVEKAKDDLIEFYKGEMVRKSNEIKQLASKSHNAKSDNKVLMRRVDEVEGKLAKQLITNTALVTKHNAVTELTEQVTKYQEQLQSKDKQIKDLEMFTQEKTQAVVDSIEITINNRKVKFNAREVTEKTDSFSRKHKTKSKRPPTK